MIQSSSSPSLTSCTGERKQGLGTSTTPACPCSRFVPMGAMAQACAPCYVAPMIDVGSTVGGYRILRPLGQGGMGVVYLAEHALLGRHAAIKVLLPTLSAQQEIVQRFFNEARAVTQISDPGIVQVFDFGYREDGSAFIVMEFLEGEALDQRLHRLAAMEP